MISDAIWEPLRLSLQVTALATVLLFVVGLALGVLLARVDFPGRVAVETVILLPLVLPPSVVGYYLLLTLGRGSFVRDSLGLDILFTWWAAALASAVVGLPLMVQATRAAVANVDPALENAARTLGSTEIGVFLRITLPLARRGVLVGLLLGAARALGEFGATLMVAGSIPGRTQTLPLAIYDAVQVRDYALANQMVIIMTAMAFLGLWWVRRHEGTRQPPHGWRRAKEEAGGAIQTALFCTQTSSYIGAVFASKPTWMLITKCLSSLAHRGRASPPYSTPLPASLRPGGARSPLMVRRSFSVIQRLSQLTYRQGSDRSGMFYRTTHYSPT